MPEPIVTPARERGVRVMAERPDAMPITATVDQFRVISGLSKDSIYKLINSGEIRSIVICGRRLIDLDSFRKLVARTSQHTAPKRGGIGGVNR